MQSPFTVYINSNLNLFLTKNKNELYKIRLSDKLDYDKICWHKTAIGNDSFYNMQHYHIDAGFVTSKQACYISNFYNRSLTLSMY